MGIESSILQVKLDIRLAAGLESKKVAVEEAQKLDPRWIVLDGYYSSYLDCFDIPFRGIGICVLKLIT